jgi:polysaccharide biosynthesis transport protein
MEHLNQEHEALKHLIMLPRGRTALENTHASIYEGDGGSRYAFENGAESDDSSLLEYWHVVARYKWPVVLSAIGGLILGVLVALPITPVYEASTSLEVLSVNDNFMNTKQTSPVTTSDLSYDVSEEETQVSLLQSAWLQQRVMVKLDPTFVVSTKNQSASSGWRALLHLPNPNVMTERQRLLSKAALSLKVKTTPRTRIIEASVRSTDKQLALDFVNTLANEFIEQNVEARRTTTQKVSDWLSGEIEDARIKLRRAENALQGYARTSGLIFTADDKNIATEKLQQLQLDLSVAATNRITKQSNYELAQTSPPDSLPGLLDDENYRAAQAEVNTLRGQSADLSARFTPEYSKVKSVQAQLIALESSLAKQRDSIVLRIKNDYDDAVRKEKLLAVSYAAQTREVAVQGEKAVQYNILKRDVDSSRQLYDTMLQQMKESSVASALHASNVRVADPAQFPEKPVWPNFKMTAALGLFAGLFLSLAIVLIRERTDRTLQNPGDVQLWTNLLELGSVPSLAASRKQATYDVKVHRSGSKSSPRSAQHSLLGDPTIAAVSLITWSDGSSVIAEAFRSILTSILFVGEKDNNPRVLVVSSSGPSDGKTTVVSNLAIAAAEIGRHVLIIDADLRRPRQHDIFKVENNHGLSDLLKGHKASASTIDSMVQATQIPGLHILPSGPSTNAAANLLYSPNLLDLLAKVKHDYDMVLIDTPPMLQLTDARVVGRLADGVVVVARAGKTSRDAIMALARRFAEDRVRVLGTVLNDWNPKKTAKSYYGNYYASYYKESSS